MRLNAAFVADKGIMYPATKAMARRGTAALKLVKAAQWLGGCSISSTGKTLGSMDANMKEHRVNAHYFPSGPTWLRRGVR